MVDCRSYSRSCSNVENKKKVIIFVSTVWQASGSSKNKITNKNKKQRVIKKIIKIKLVIYVFSNPI